jgi:hypothetical protein
MAVARATGKMSGWRHRILGGHTGKSSKLSPKQTTKDRARVPLGADRRRRIVVLRGGTGLGDQCVRR